ncbi:S8 family peptidase [Paenibacillus sp. DXFW5]|uniref:S8 family peptidase n=1 Tax=Paenibacillus rhizolycopersici TaxID=2780073 RepID=A0ABS2H8A9_9BACL|nr:S8 family peptidase [Paenibacillus rhizolycopersici]MBM6996090.1 S8 family peptidase [Paenibacillus rhizolycopersici]
MFGIQKLDHIEISREERVRPYKFRANPNAPKPPIRDRQAHGNKLAREIQDSSKYIHEQRLNIGIEPNKLIVLSITNNTMSQDLLNQMIMAFDLSLIEEVSETRENFSRILVQFPDEESIIRFNNERVLWELDSKMTGVLTYARRRDIFSCIEQIRPVQREDRIGPRLKKKLAAGEPLPEGFFIVDIDIWFNGDRSQISIIEKNISNILGTTGSSLLGDLFETPSLLLGRIKVNQFSFEALLNYDLVALVDFPLGTVFEEPSEIFATEFEYNVDNTLDDSAPLATILDSGVFSGHPLLHNVIVAEEDFDLTEGSTSDYNGHGSGVAGIVAYGDFFTSISTKQFSPSVRICNAKIMHDNQGWPSFNPEKRPEKIVIEAIQYFHREYGCRVFNLSAGNIDMVYNSGRQMPWAEALDQLTRELDIVIIISAGNVNNPLLHDFETREELHGKSRDQLFDYEHKLIDPATASLCVTVGSISRFDEPELVKNKGLRLSAGPKHSPSVFTRIGKGLNKAIKPELVDYGGNFAVHQIFRGNNRWVINDRVLLEPTLNHNLDKLFRGYSGTSFAAPRVTNLAARIERSLEEQTGEKPSANLIRAVLVNSASLSTEMVEWAEKSTDMHYTGKTNPKQERKHRLLGYGKPHDSWLYSSVDHVTLFSEDALDLRSFHLYKIPVPSEFLSVKSSKKISISLAFNPVTRLSRKDYLANNVWFEVYRKIDEEKLAAYKAKKESGDNSEDEPLPDAYKADFSPGVPEVDSSTLQQRIWSKGKSGGKDLLDENGDSYIYILVTGKERFKYAQQELPQTYALVITFSFEGDQDIQLYNKLQQKVRIKERQKTRVRTQL